MKIISISCRSFRNLENIILLPEEGMNIIFGENAQGKTNLLESIWMFTGAKSFRISNDSAFVEFSKKRAVCELVFEKMGTEYCARMEFGEKRTAYLNETKLSSPVALAGEFSAVVFTPLDLQIVNDGPAARRKFLDLAIGQLYPGYIKMLHSYNKAVLQRNQTLKDYKYDRSLYIMLDAFEQEIAVKGEKIIRLRKRYTDILSEIIPEIYSGISDNRESLTVGYTGFESAELLADKLKNSREEDALKAITSVGPHRDDLVLELNGRSLRGYGSQGQRRSAALSLKLAQGEAVYEKSGEYPVCLLDDVMSELDPRRQAYVLNRLEKRQTLLTCCDPADFEGLERGSCFEIKNGNIVS